MQRIALKENSESFPFWKDIPVPIYERFYFFNITNPQEIERFGAKPNLKEIGPFTYRMYLNKTRVTFNPNGTVTYREKKTWYFRRDLSVADESQIVTTLNGPLALTLTLIQSAPSAVRVIVNLALEALTEGFFIKRSVKQLLFQGYPDVLTSFAPLMNPDITQYTSGRFAWLIGKNATDDGIFNVFTGVDDIETFNLIDNFKNLSQLPYWLTQECNSFKGATNGEARPPLAGETSVRIFHPDLCRILELEYNNTHIADGTDDLVARRYLLSEKTFKNSADHPPNACYDTKFKSRSSSVIGNQATPATSRLQSILNLRRTLPSLLSPPPPVAQAQTTKLPSGVFDISKCKYGVPIVVSPPHFMGSDLYYRSAIEGLKPNESRHNFWLDVDPTTGTTISLAARVQINVAINKGPGFRYRNVPNIVFPVFWQEMMIEMDPVVGEKLWLASHLPTILGSVTSYSFFSMGILLTFSALIILLFKSYRVLQGPKESSDKSASQSVIPSFYYSCSSLPHLFSIS